MHEVVAYIVTGGGAAVAIIVAIAWGLGHVRRQAAKAAAGQVSDAELDAIHSRLAALEQGAAETEERVDFVERALSQSREAARLRDPAGGGGR